MAQLTVAPEAPPAPKPGPGGWAIPFSSLRHRDFAILWLTQLGTGSGLWMEIIARSWLVYQMTGSGVLLGTVNLMRALPQLVFGLMAGVVADRWDRKKILLISMTANALLTLAIPVLIWTGTIEVWHILATSFLAGIAMAFQMPTRQAVLPSLVPKEDLMNAIALSNAAMNITRVGGPALAGLLIAWIDVPGAYMAKFIVFIFAIALTFYLRLPPVLSAAGQKGMLSNFFEGIDYVVHHTSVRTIILVTLIPMLFGMPFMTVMPIFAKEVLGVGPEGFGLLQSAPGVGALGVAFLLASLGDIRGKGWIMIGGTILFGVSLLFLGVTTWMPLALLWLLCTGIGQTVFNTSANTLLVTLTPEELRARVFSIYMLDMGLNSLGAMVVGALADVTGVGTTFMLMGAICALLALGVGVVTPAVRRL